MQVCIVSPFIPEEEEEEVEVLPARYDLMNPK